MNRSAAIVVVLLGLLGMPARAEISQSQSAREYVAELKKKLADVTAERDRALEEIEDARRKAKETVDRTIGNAVAREAALAEARRRIEALEGKLATVVAKQERLRAELEGLVEARRRADKDHAKREAELIDRARSADRAREESERLAAAARAETEEARVHARNELEEAQANARAEIERLTSEVATARGEADEARRLANERDELTRETVALHAQQLGELQTHILHLERTLASETETRLALGSHMPIASGGPALERLGELEKELGAKTHELAELEKRSAGDQKELRALRSAREGLERELEAARADREPTLDEVISAALVDEEEEPAELRRLLALERERRSTLEGELVRLSATGDVAERYRESWQALQAARADLLILSEKLAGEQEKREELEALLDRARAVAAKGGESDDTPLERLIDVASQHGRETDRLAADLERATDQITRLRGYLETIESPDGVGPALAKLDEENAALKLSLKDAEKTIGRLSGQAALAERLAELVYSRHP